MSLCCSDVFIKARRLIRCGFDDGAVVALASDPAPPGVAAPFTSEPLPFFPGADTCPVSLPDWFALFFVWSLECASARLGRRANTIVARTLAFIGVSSETFCVPRLTQLNTGRGAFDPELIASLFGVDDVGTCELRLNCSRKRLLGG
jgi:hypothetical protein